MILEENKGFNFRYGRRRTFQGAVSLTLISDVATYFCKQQIPFLVARFFSAAGSGSIASVAFVLGKPRIKKIMRHKLEFQTF